MKQTFFFCLALSLAVVSPLHAESTWNIDTPMASVPNTPLSGSLFGHKLNATNVSAKRLGDTIILGFAKEQNNWPLAEVWIFTTLEQAEQEWVITPNAELGDAPHIHLKFMIAGNDMPSTLIFMEAYSMRLKVKEVGNELQGSIHLSLPDYKKSYLIGTFETQPGF